jgi:fumarylpyruvate hydrolase
MSTQYLFSPPTVCSIPIKGKSEQFPVRRIFCVGRNYQAHAAEMGSSVDKSTAKPFYFTKHPSAIILSGAVVPYALNTSDLHYEMELVVALQKGGVHVSEENVDQMIYGYACGLDMTRRDVQAEAKKKSLPWDLGKDFEHSAVISSILATPGIVLEKGHIELSVNGSVKQSSDIQQMIWNIRELVADLSNYYHLQPGDLIYTGTPEGVGPVVAGDKMTGSIEGVGTIEFSIQQ